MADQEDSGLYVIALSLKKETKARTGALGVVSYPPGVYLYTGSARVALSKRVARHRSSRKKKRWHIDYLRARAAWEGCALFPGGEDECALAAKVAKATGAVASPPRFGASDCSCPGHLAFTGMAATEALEKMKSLGCGRVVWRSGPLAGRMEPGLKGRFIQ